VSPRVRLTVAVALAALIAAFAAPAAFAGFGPSVFEAGTCNAKGCEYSNPPSAFYTQAAGHPEWGITSFEVNTSGSGSSRKPEGQVKRLRVDVPPGLAADPQALPSCSRAEFSADPKKCEVAGAKVGETEVIAALEVPLLGVTDTTQMGNVYNLTQEPGLPLLFGIAIEPTGGVLLSPVHLFLEGHVSDASEPALAARGIPSGDYHEWFEINDVPKTAEAEVLGTKTASASLSLIKSKLFFEGRKGGNFLTLPSVCSSSTTSYLELESYEGGHASTPTHTPVGVSGCDKVPFQPTAQVVPQTSTYDSPDGATTIVKVPQKAGATETNTADIKDAHVTLPEGLTLNPSAAHGLEACTAAQIGIGSSAPVSCPAASRVGSVTIETDLPPKTLSGGVYLGSPGGGAITGPPYTIYLDAESVYGVSVRLQGSVVPDANGRLTASFVNNPQLPFSELILSLNGGPRAPLANPLACGAAPTDALFTPYTGGANGLSSTPFTTTGCPSPLPFAPAQSTQNTSPNGGAYTAYTFNLTRPDGQQYLSQLRTVLPPGLVGAIPSVPLCGEPLAQQGACPATSKIGTATVNVGAGTEPYPFSGSVYLTGPYAGAPYGLSIPVAAVAPPFNLGIVVTRVGLNVDSHTGQVIATTSLPTIVGGVPLRLRSLSVAVNRPNFLFNPTNCGALSTSSLLTSTFKATKEVSSPFQVKNCTALPFKPNFGAATSAVGTKLNGDSLKVNLLQGVHEANLHSIVASLPPQLPSRLSTIQKACPEQTFAISPLACRTSRVGTATAVTPVLPKPLTGSAYLVSHAAAAFPDLDLVLEGNGVTVVLVGNTNIKNGITTSTFASIPDVPVSSFVLDLPTGANSALTSFGNLCLKPLLMPTTITAQSGTVIKQNTRVAVSGCGVRILSHRVKGHKLILKVRTLGAGQLKIGGKGLRGAKRRFSKSATTTFRLPLSGASLRALRRHPHRVLHVTVHAAFTPAKAGALRSGDVASATFNKPHHKKRHKRSAAKHH
jgi:hypothetical protein